MRQGLCPLREFRGYGVAKPVKAPVCGEPVAVSVKVMVPLRFAPLGANKLVNRTVTVQEAPGAKVVPVQLLVPATMLKAYCRFTGATTTLLTTVEVPPVADVLMKFTIPVPVLLPVASVINSGLGEIDTVALVVVLVPVRLTGVGVTVSPVEATVSVRLYVPAVVGAVNTTLMVQVAPTASVPPVVQVPPAAPAGLEKG